MSSASFGPLWPQPPHSRLRRGAMRAGSVVANAVIVVVGLFLGSGIEGVRGREDDPVVRLGNVRAGQTQLISVEILGNPAWGTRFGRKTSLKLSAGGVVHSDSGRAVPVRALAPVAIYKPRGKAGLGTVRRSSWILDVDGSPGAGTIVASLGDLALIAAVAQWPVPPELPSLLASRRRRR